jgi:hypothetical protein
MMPVFGKSEEERYIMRCYRATFTVTEEGQIVYDHLMRDLGCFSESATDEDRIKKNVAMRIMMYMGILTNKNTMEISRKLFEVPTVIDGRKSDA